MKIHLPALLCLILFSNLVSAQYNSRRDHDSTYYVSFPEHLTTRVYLSRKYTTLKFIPPEGPAVRYRSNTSLNIGIGATYRAVTINIGIGLTRFNPNNVKGETKYLDLQAHLYERKWSLDFLGEFYRGYYLSPKGDGTTDDSYYTRKDLNLSLLGVAFYRTLNDRHFSYQAGLEQNEWQKKSAGSLLIGGEVYYGSIHADSTLVPKLIDSTYANKELSKIHFFQIGPGIGYGYTLVIAEHYFLLASGTVNLALRYAMEKSATLNLHGDKLDFYPNFIVHAGAGYNTRNWSLSLLWVSTQLNVHGNTSGYRYTVTTGNYRLIFAKRFKLNHKTRKMLQPINDVMGK
jgi:Domain of unknown function (DUF4421)